MTKKEVKNILKNYGIYSFIHDLIVDKTLTSDDLYKYESVIYSFLDCFDDEQIKQAIKKATR